MSKEKPKKERVIHTRVSEAMDEELREKAEALGISVSNLVRNVLSSTLGLVEGLVADSADIARAARGQAPRERGGEASLRERGGEASPRERRGEVIGWQTLILNRNALCEHCNDILPRGTTAALGVTNPVTSPGPVICTGCLAGIQADQPKETHDPAAPEPE